MYVHSSVNRHFSNSHLSSHHGIKQTLLLLKVYVTCYLRQLFNYSSLQSLTIISVFRYTSTVLNLFAGFFIMTNFADLDP